MISFPHAKINLGLSIISKRPDGFHNLETIFYPIPIRDVLEIVPADETHIIQTGLEVPGNISENIVQRAYRLLKEKYTQISPLGIHLHKAIPVGAGLGGGSSDAAGFIRLVNRYFQLSISEEDLKNQALELGSDCPFFMQSDPCFASGRGEILEPVSLDLSGYSFILIHPEIRIKTSWAFSKIKPVFPLFDLRESISQPVENWVHRVKNDFEPIIFETYPALRDIKNLLYQSGALYASMTGSGSTIYGIFPKGELPEIAVENAGISLIG
jgi:4-diphosphocytidyl-2-C-methyl-D-erythritol kinase